MKSLYEIRFANGPVWRKRYSSVQRAREAAENRAQSMNRRFRFWEEHETRVRDRQLEEHHGPVTHILTESFDGLPVCVIVTICPRFRAAYSKANQKKVARGAQRERVITDAYKTRQLEDRKPRRLPANSMKSSEIVTVK
jgi:hypothetical protein